MSRTKDPWNGWLERTLHTLKFHYKLCLRQDQFDREMKRLGVIDRCKLVRGNGATCHFFRDKKDNQIVIVGLNDDPKYSREQVYAMLAHEAMHIVQAHCEEIGEHKPSDEFQAYALQAICQKLFESYIKQTTKKAERY